MQNAKVHSKSISRPRARCINEIEKVHPKSILEGGDKMHFDLLWNFEMRFTPSEMDIGCTFQFRFALGLLPRNAPSHAEFGI